MNAGTLTSPALCAPPCDTPSLPLVLVAALMRHHRRRAGLNARQAADTIGTSASRIGSLERAQPPMSAATASAVLTAYGTPAREAEQARELLARPGHRHHLDTFVPSRGWMEALRTGARRALIYSADPVPAWFLPPSDERARTSPGGRPASSNSCHTSLLVHSSALHEQPEMFCHLVAPAEIGVLSVHLVPDDFARPAAPLIQYTCTAWGWDGSASQLLRRQVYVTAQPGAGLATVRNGAAATSERQLLEEALVKARPSQWSLLQLRRSACGWHPAATALDGHRAPKPTPPSDALAADCRSRSSA